MKMCSIFDFAFILYTTKGIQSGEKSEIAHNNDETFFIYRNKILTTARGFNDFKSANVWPVPMNTIGCPVMYVIEIAAPTLNKL